VRALVTGAGGMIGAAVLAAEGRGDVELRRHVGAAGSNGSDPGGEQGETGRSVVCDITDRDALRTVADGVDVVIHLAGPPSVAESFADAAEFLRVHVLGTEAVVQLCRELGIPRLVYVSSAEVYGRPARNPVDESASLGPRSPYAAAKVGAESVIGAAARSWGLDAVVLRPFSIYGPGLRQGSVVGLVVEQALAGDHIRLRSLGSTRDYCYVGDLADAVWTAAARGGGRGDEPAVFNVATGRGTRVDELAATALAARGIDPESATIEAVAETEADRPATADILELVGDVERARTELGWQATTSLVDGLRQTLDWFAGTVVER
jgi:nucleoside-diphosphate-sugar epimerase